MNSLPENIKILIDHLKSGGAIGNVAQQISYDSETGTGFMDCDTPGCCDTWFESLDEIVEYLTDSDIDPFHCLEK